MKELSRRAQDYLDGIPVEEEALSPEKKADIYRRVMKRMEGPAAAATPPAKRRIRPLYLAAAAVAMVGLVGAGYATSVYFDKLYRFVDFGEEAHYDREADPELLVEPPVLAEDSLEEPPTVIRAGNYREAMEEIAKMDAPGEVMNLEIHTPDGRWTAYGIGGNALNLVFTAGEKGAPGSALLTKPEAPSPEQVVSRAIADGEFMAAIDHPAYTLTEFEAADYRRALTYEDGEGGRVDIAFTRLHGQIEISAELADGLETAEMEINGNRFLLVQKREQWTTLHLYLGELEEAHTTALRIDCQGGSREQVLEVARSIRLYNTEANRITVPGEAFFAGLPQEDIRAAAALIAQGVEAYGRKEHRDGLPQRVWEKDGAAVEVYDAPGRRTAVTSREGFHREAPLYPYAGHTVLVEQSWFPAGLFDELQVVYEGVEPLYAVYRAEDGSFLHTGVQAAGYARSPLDAILAKMDRDEYVTLERAIDPLSDHPIVVGLNEERAWIYAAKQTGDGRYLVETLCIPREELPGEPGGGPQ